MTCSSWACFAGSAFFVDLFFRERVRPYVVVSPVSSREAQSYRPEVAVFRNGVGVNSAPLVLRLLRCMVELSNREMVRPCFAVSPVSSREAQVF